MTTANVTDRAAVSSGPLSARPCSNVSIRVPLPRGSRLQRNLLRQSGDPPSPECGQFGGDAWTRPGVGNILLPQPGTFRSLEKERGCVPIGKGSSAATLRQLRGRPERRGCAGAQVYTASPFGFSRPAWLERRPSRYGRSTRVEQLAATRTAADCTPQAESVVRGNFDVAGCTAHKTSPGQSDVTSFARRSRTLAMRGALVRGAPRTRRVEAKTATAEAQSHEVKDGSRGTAPNSKLWLHANLWPGIGAEKRRAGCCVHWARPRPRVAADQPAARSGTGYLRSGFCGTAQG